MTLEQLIAIFREDAGDQLEPFLWSNDVVLSWFNEAQSEAAVRGRLLLDDYTPAVCQIPVEAGRASYPLHSKVYEIAHIRLEPAPQSQDGLKLVTREYLDRIEPQWRTRQDMRCVYVIQSETTLRLVPAPRDAGQLVLEAYRLPLKQLQNDMDKPEIHEAHHARLVHWVLYRAFSKPDADGFDAGRAQQAYTEFEKYFGARPDSDLRRSTRHDEPQVNVSYVF